MRAGGNAASAVTRHDGRGRVSWRTASGCHRSTRTTECDDERGFEMPQRVGPLQDAIRHVSLRTDKTGKLCVKYINAVKGRGIFAESTISRGQFVAEYRGDLINDAEFQRRRRVYHPSCAAFMFAFKWRGKTWCIDASREDESFGRLVNDEHRRPNCRMKWIDVDGKPHLCLFALTDIHDGEEITYDYGGEDCPWRTQMTSMTVTDVAPQPSSLPQSQMEDDRCPLNMLQEVDTFYSLPFFV
ncbi:probable histone-lysine N-methyltransferase set-1 [Hippocampus comes]|uniref:probable histone-lysine N-methyltransferase set-1 n=1 Tax=Hippocampus comes TaxID=109280 RepID=UPI00094E71D3|nr:PREDICTED: probable histone-lysine N-methyltransferase set-1 [Hippocampus comes]